MTFIERVLRVMTHLNIGASLAMALWILWSGLALIDPSREVARPMPAPTVPAAPSRREICPCEHQSLTAHDLGALRRGLPAVRGAA